MCSSPSPPQPYRAVKLIFVPLLLFSLITQGAIVWTQLEEIRDGYFDFPLYYAAAKIINDGNGARLYDLAVQRDYQKEFGARDKDWDLPFNHPPYELLILLPLAKLSFPMAHALWTAMNLLLLALTLARFFPFVQPKQRPLFVLVVLAYFPTITTLKMGQDSILTTFLLVETYISLRRQRHGVAGALLALGLYKPQFVLPLLGILALQGRRPLIASFLGTGLLLGFISLGMVGWDGLMGLFSLWLSMVDRGHIVWPERMTNLRGMVYVILNLVGLSAATNSITVALSALAFIVTLRLWPPTLDQEDPIFDLRFALGLIMTALVSFHCYPYDATFLSIPVIILLNQVLKEPQPSSLRHRVLWVLLIMLFFPFVPNLLLSASAIAWWAMPLIALFVVTAIEIVRRSGQALRFVSN